MLRIGSVSFSGFPPRTASTSGATIITPYTVVVNTLVADQRLISGRLVSPVAGAHQAQRGAYPLNYYWTKSLLTNDITRCIPQIGYVNTTKIPHGSPVTRRAGKCGRSVNARLTGACYHRAATNSSDNVKAIYFDIGHDEDCCRSPCATHCTCDIM